MKQREDKIPSQAKKYPIQALDRLIELAEATVKPELVHEAYLRLGSGGSFGDRSEFLRAALVSMRRILVDHARTRKAAKRGGDGRRFPINEGDRVVVPDPDTLLDVDEAPTRLAEEDPTSAEVARFRLFAGLSVKDAADALGLSRATAFREWAYGRSWLTAALTAKNRGEPGEDPRT